MVSAIKGIGVPKDDNVRLFFLSLYNFEALFYFKHTLSL